MLAAAERGFRVEHDGKRVGIRGLRQPGWDNREPAQPAGAEAFTPAGGPVLYLDRMAFGLHRSVAALAQLANQRNGRVLVGRKCHQRAIISLFHRLPGPGH